MIKFIVLALVLFLIGCTDPETEARALLNQAVALWHNGEIDAAMVMFDRVQAEHITTTTATEALSIRASLEKDLQEKFAPEFSRNVNRGKYASNVFSAVRAHFREKGAYPETLKEIVPRLNSASRRYVDYCEYERAGKALGMRLDCRGIRQAYQRDLNQRRTNIPPRPIRVDANNFKVSTTSWGARLNPSGEIPGDEFFAFYFRQSDPGELVYRETTPVIGLEYSRSGFHGIDYRDLGAYWVGRFSTDIPKTYALNIKQSHARTRVLVNGLVVFEGSEEKRVLLSLEPGAYVVEVEHLNQWHTTNFGIHLDDYRLKLMDSEVSELLRKAALVDSDLWYVGIHDTENKDRVVEVTLNQSNQPVSLYLSSYHAVRWRISNPMSVEVNAILYGSHLMGATVEGDIDDKTYVMQVAETHRSFGPDKTCSCDPGQGFVCAGYGLDLSESQSKLRAQTGMNLVGTSRVVKAGSVIVPEVVITDRLTKEYAGQSEKLRNLEKECRDRLNPDFEDVVPMLSDPYSVSG